MADKTQMRSEISQLILAGDDDSLDEVHQVLDTSFVLNSDQVDMLATIDSERARALLDYNARLTEINRLRGLDIDGNKAIDEPVVEVTPQSRILSSVGNKPVGKLSIDELLDRGDERSLGELAGRIERGDASDLTNDHIRRIQGMDRDLTSGVRDAMQPKAAVRTEAPVTVQIWPLDR